jgi:hypothetical protein
MNLHRYFDPTSGLYVLPGKDRMDTYERPAVAHAVLERQRFVRRAYGIVDRCADGPYGADVDEALGFSAHSRNVWALLEDVAPPRWEALLARLEQIERWQAGWDAQGDAEEATR